MKSHLKRKHQLRISKYKTVYGGLHLRDRVRHVCRICGREVAFTSYNLYAHLRLYHQEMASIRQEWRLCWGTSSTGCFRNDPHWNEKLSSRNHFQAFY